jgi:D-amino peptidase
MKLPAAGLAICLALSPAPARAASPPRILVIYDMEGVSGIDREALTDSRNPAYPEGRKYLTADVNAAIRGLKAGGAGAIWVQDGHGSGNADEPDVLLDQMDPRASFDFREFDFDPYSTGLDASLDGIACVGMHARAGQEGFLAHTWTLEPSFRVNGVDLTETQIIALSAARFGVPVITTSGDDVLGRQLETALPDLEYAAVKKAVSRAKAEPLPADESARRIEAAARKGMEKLLAGRFRPYYMQPPFVFEIGFQNPAQASRVRSDKSVDLSGERTVRFTAPTFVEGYERCKHLIALATAERVSLLTRLLQQSDDGRKTLDRYRELLLQRWLDPDALPDWARDEKAPPPRKRFHGDN